MKNLKQPTNQGKLQDLGHFKTAYTSTEDFLLDLLFAEACAKLGVRLQLLQPFPEAEFIQRSILPSEQGQS
ncbi:MAG: hypothetical protein ACXWTH_04330 [Methylosarcina sp.]